MTLNDNGFHLFTAPFVFHYTVPEHQQLKQELKPKLELFYESHHQEKKYKWTNDPAVKSKVCTNFNQAYQQKTWYTQNNLQQIVWNSLDKLFEQLKSKTQKCRVTTFWWNVYQQGDSAPVHNHGSFGISGIYLLELNEPNKTVFLYNHRALLKHEQDLEYYETSHIPEGTVLLFPSSLNHHVEPAETTRMTISFNVEII
jgi:uncharacterized protein (TIGR02466 family)